MLEKYYIILFLYQSGIICTGYP